MSVRTVVPLLFLLLLAPSLAAQEEQPQTTDTCLTCHSSVLQDDPSKNFADDVHHNAGLTCAACHGGDPTATEMDAAMSPVKGYIGVPRRDQIPQLCAHCHSDAAFMRNYNPSLRTDQLAQYRTSVHGQRLAQGDTHVAVCSDCHGTHDIRPAPSPLSHVNPLQIPNTCGRCHSDAQRMKPYKIPTDQLASYKASVHYQALQGGDLSAPNCATCHGNHGAAPPGVSSVERVCGTCHVFQEQLFDKSPHKEPWAAMGLATCVTCHSNHKILPTSDALIGTSNQSFCVTCHSEGEPGWNTAKEIHADLTGLDTELASANEILDRAEQAGMEVGEARLIQSSAHEQLIKARVEVHTLDPAQIGATITKGDELAQQAHQGGVEALAELAFRRKGLALSLLAIAFVVLSLWLLIRDLERRRPLPGPPPQD